MSYCAVECRAPLSRRRLGPLFRDLAVGFEPQMYFWGRDAAHPDGNLFQRYGFQRRPSNGLQGTSCYCLPWQGGRIELHGSHAGWFGENEGFLFVRPLLRCVHWLGGDPPVPGEWPQHRFCAGSPPALFPLARHFLAWWLEHETFVREIAGQRFRIACHRQYRKLPRTKTWLAPDAASEWIQGFIEAPETLPRARRFSTSNNTTPA